MSQALSDQFESVHGEDVIAVLAGVLEDGDVLLMQGAGNIGALSALSGRLAESQLQMGQMGQMGKNE